MYFKLKIFSLLVLIFFVSCKEEAKKADPFEEPTQETVNPVPIEVENPAPEEKISSPTEISGRARGTWFFEGSFAVFLYDEDQNEIAVAIATAQEDWMTEDWVLFSATLKFDTPESKKGTLIFKKSNPTGKAKFDDSIKIPVKFSE